MMKPLAAAILLLFSLQARAKPLKVFVLAGQSNMQGHAKVSTFDHLADDPETAPMLREMRDSDGQPTVCDDVWISALGIADKEKHGRLTAGYGVTRRESKIGPEFTFGIYMHKWLNEPVLIIKTAWGGKSLHTDFRPPSMGTYRLNDSQKERFRQRGQDVAEKQAEAERASGHYYRLMIQHVKKVLNDIERVYPDYDKRAGYELAGFVWFQGWNDRVDSGVYPARDKPGGYDTYSECLAAFIRDVRKDLAALGMKFVVGVMGVNGPLDSTSSPRTKAVHGNFRAAMAAPASWPEFKGNVYNVFTETCWDAELGELARRWEKVKNKSRALQRDKKLSRAERDTALEQFKAELFTPAELALREKAISNAAYHYLGSAKIMARIGKAFAEPLAENPAPLP
jgi:alpha-galactosidase